MDKRTQLEITKTAGAREAIGDFLRGDDKGLDWKWGLLGGGGIKALVNALGKSHAVRQTSNIPRGALESNRAKLLRGLSHQRIKDLGYTTVRINKNVPFLNKAVTYNPISKVFTVGEQVKNPGFFAHELGKLSTPKFLSGLRAIGSGIRGGGFLASLLSPDQDVSKNFATLGTAGGLGALAPELYAAHRSSKILSNDARNSFRLRSPGNPVKVLRKYRLGAYHNIPYAALTASTPALAYNLKKYFGGFDDNANINLFDQTR